jgi:acetyl-CoA carboxylase biotin carboxylase subunit
MRRALAEYDVIGIRTTIPFFQWLLEDEDFVNGRFDTGFIDRKLGARNGQPLREPDESHEELAAIVVALSRASATATAGSARSSRWNDHARRDALR